MANERHVRTILLVVISVGMFVTTLLLIQGDRARKVFAAQLAEPHSEVNSAEGVTLESSGQANCRYGITTAETTSHVIPRTGAGVFYKFNEPNWFGPLPEGDAELLHMIKTRQRKTATGEYLPAWYIPKINMGTDLAKFILEDVGALWIVGNEVERGPNSGETWSPRTGDMYADIYAEAYHDVYHFIKGIDPTARVANAGLIQITPMRLQYLNMVWDAYKEKYGEDMPVDVWTIHTYVLPELTAGGEPNNIASAALGTDIELGKRNAGGDTSKCADDMVYCYAEHDDISILADQVIAMRQWMKEHGQQNKPLIITEYGTIYHYIVKEDGSCGGLRDEYGKCFTPARVTQFMLDSFDYFNNEARDANLGLPSDNNRLVQQWIWYGAWEWDIGSSNLLKNWDSMEFTQMGQAFRDHVGAEEAHVNLVIDEVKSTVIAYEDDATTTARLTVRFRNNGNVSVQDSFKVTFYSDEERSEEIGSATISAKIRGCASRTYTAQAVWDNLPQGVHRFWVEVDSNGDIAELPADSADNVGSGEVQATGPVYDLDVKIISDGEGQGGVVTREPDEEAYPEETVVKLTAVPFSGWTFEGWSGAVVGIAPNAQLTMYNDSVVEAHFRQERYALEISKRGKGQVLVTPEPTNEYYFFGDQIELLAIPAEGWRFVKWSGDVEQLAPRLEITFEDDVTVRAHFEEVVSNLAGNIFLPMAAGK